MPGDGLYIKIVVYDTQTVGESFYSKTTENIISKRASIDLIMINKVININLLC